MYEWKQLLILQHLLLLGKKLPFLSQFSFNTPNGSLNDSEKENNLYDQHIGA